MPGCPHFVKNPLSVTQQHLKTIGEPKKKGPEQETVTACKRTSHPIPAQALM